MGAQDIHADAGGEAQRAFTRALLEDVEALEQMLQSDVFETGVRRIGAEQEFFLVDSAGYPAKAAQDLLERLDGPFTVELGLFNLEANLPPLELGGNCLTEMELLVSGYLDQARKAAKELGVRIALCGILPTLSREQLTLDWMTPIPRFHKLNEVMTELRGGEFRTLIKGLDELETTHDNVMFEACNTSFQLHFQVAPDEFARLYNLAQVVLAPVLAVSVNSPLFLQHRLWHETRVALFQQSLDTRSAAHTKRGGRQRVHFGERWVERSVLELYREDVGRFRTLLSTELEESSLAQLEKGEVPSLKALCLHNGTVYRWNRPCYGVKDGVPHLRIENRVLPSGPTPLDEVANSAFYFGLMLSLGESHEDVRRAISFDDAKGNFMAAARYGLHANFRWLNGETGEAGKVVLDKLLPLAHEGLVGRGLDTADVDRYMDVIEQRVKADRTGAQWALDSLAAMGSEGTLGERCSSLTADLIERGEGGEPVHTWPLSALRAQQDARASYRTISQVMTQDLFTLHPDDLVDLAASLMDWEHVRHVPVEDNEGCLVGIVSHRQLLRIVGRSVRGERKPVAVSEIMKANPVTVTPDTATREAIACMREHRVGCLPVIEEGKLVGIVTETDFIRVAADLLDRWLGEE